MEISSNLPFPPIAQPRRIPQSANDGVELVEDGEIVGGRDGRAGGTWLACTKDGKVAFVTNVREIPSHSQVKSRGDLPIRFLKSQKSPKEFAEELVAEADQYNGFNLIVADLCSMTMLYITNRPKDDGPSITEVAPGIHVLSNAKLDTPWPKAQRLRQSFEDVVQKCCDAEISMEEITEKLMTDTTKDDDEQELLSFILLPLSTFECHFC
ncbi:UNVERIFIED_CONTAM: hypothetical protein Scaly_2636600 [Sesamum calycinum]|uniref:Uncharacterized protein n=1 Tax=Sesamum calycinum TaxID=2727403 RepID=A0AAW2JBX2_9LAMI